jgi:polysaccharide export outer membrane protein
MKSLAILLVLSFTFSLVTNVKAQTVEFSQYTLGSGDTVSITVYGQEDLSLETRLTDIGVINYPYLGEISVLGMTVSGLESFIYEGLKGDYLVNPSVSVSIIEYRPFFINGEVKDPGGYPYQPGLTVDKAAALAGGYTERASKTKIFIDRSVNGKQVTLGADRYMQILPGDIVNIEQSFF